MLTHLLKRSVAPGCIRRREDAVEIFKSVLQLRSTSRQTGGIPYGKIVEIFTSKDASVVGEALPTVDPQEPLAGKSMATLVKAVPSIGCDEALWENIVRRCEEALQAAKWRPREMQQIIREVAYWKVYPPTFPATVEQYVANSLDDPLPTDVPHLAKCLCSFPEIVNSSLMSSIAQKGAYLAEEMSAKQVGQLCGALVKAKQQSAELLITVMESAPRWCEEGIDAATCYYLLSFALMHEEIAAQDVDSIAVLFEVVGTTETLQLEHCSGILGMLPSLPAAMKDQCDTSYTGMLRTIFSRLALLVPDAELSVVATCELLSLVFGYVDAEKNKDLLPLDELSDAALALSDAVEQVSEELVSSENPPFFVIQHLLGSQFPEARLCGLNILKEAASQKIHFPTLDTFRYLLLLADHAVFEPLVFRHLRKSFTSDAKGVPMIQLCAALKCFECAHRVIPIEPENEEELDEEADFLRFCHELAVKSTDLDPRCAMALVSTMRALGYSDETFYCRMALMMEPFVNSMQPQLHIAPVAASCLEAFAEVQGSDNVKKFLAEVVETGEQEEPEKPGDWMNEVDPSNFITPLTPEQEATFAILTEMNETRAADTETMAHHAKRYLERLEHVRVNDIQFFFAIFAEKVVKNDKLLNEALKKIISEPRLMAHLPGTTLSSILQSLGSLRFTYYATLKKFLHAVTEEQWATMDAPSLVGIIQGMSKLSLRMTGPLTQIAERLSVICSRLLPMEVALLINGLQGVGYHDPALTEMLMKHASKNARRFDDGAITVLMGSSSIHRLLIDADVSLPLISRVCGTDMPASSKQRLTLALKRSSLPRTAIEASLGRLAIEQPRQVPLELE